MYSEWFEIGSKVNLHNASSRSGPFEIVGHGRKLGFSIRIVSS